LYLTQPKSQRVTLLSTSGAKIRQMTAEVHLGFIIGFAICGAYNILGCLLFTKFFCSKSFFTVYPEVFGKEGIVFIMLWGLAYLSVSYTYVYTPFTVLVFVLEKLTYVIIYIYFLTKKNGPELIKKVGVEDPLAAMFFGCFGIGDFLSGIFFAVAFIVAIIG